MSEKTIVEATPSASPSQTLPVKVAPRAEPKAPTRILPSRPMSTTPERSDHRPARQANISGMASRTPEANTTMKASNHATARPSDRRLGGAAREQRRHRPAEHVLERPGEQHDEALDDHDHVAADLRLLEGELRPALIEHAEQDCGEDDADRMGPAHQRDRDADEAEAADEVEDKPMLVAEE